MNDGPCLLYEEVAQHLGQVGSFIDRGTELTYVYGATDKLCVNSHIPLRCLHVTRTDGDHA